MHVCALCRRHIRDDRCPFCFRRVGRLIVAIGTGAIVSACAQAVYGAPPPPSGPYTSTDSGTDGDAK